MLPWKLRWGWRLSTITIKCGTSTLRLSKKIMKILTQPLILNQRWEFSRQKYMGINLLDRSRINPGIWCTGHTIYCRSASWSWGDKTIFRNPNSDSWLRYKWHDRWLWSIGSVIQHICIFSQCLAAQTKPWWWHYWRLTAHVYFCKLRRCRNILFRDLKILLL